MTTRIVGWILRATLRLAVPAGGRASATTTADPIPHGERLIGLAVVAFLVLALFA